MNGEGIGRAVAESSDHRARPGSDPDGWDVGRRCGYEIAVEHGATQVGRHNPEDTCRRTAGRNGRRDARRRARWRGLDRYLEQRQGKVIVGVTTHITVVEAYKPDAGAGTDAGNYDTRHHRMMVIDFCVVAEQGREAGGVVSPRIRGGTYSHIVRDPSPGRGRGTGGEREHGSTHGPDVLRRW